MAESNSKARVSSAPASGPSNDPGLDDEPARQKPAPPVIELSGVVKRFADQTVLDGVDLAIDRGEIMVVMGGSGSGKTTLLRLMIGSIMPEQGTVSVFDGDLAELDEQGLDEIRKRIGVLFQSGALFQSMTIGENVALPLLEHTNLDQKIIDIQVKIYLNQVGLFEHADKYPAQLSGGMKKRAALARALALDPEIIFFDEPSAGLDPVTSAEIDRLIIDVTRKLEKTSVVVTHDMHSAFTIADHMAMLDRGKLLMVAERPAFERLRDMTAEEAAKLDEKERLIRQFLRGDAEGPMTERREQSNFADDLLGVEEPPVPAVPSIETTRVA